MSGFHRRFTLFVLAALLILAVGAGSCKAETDENGSSADTPPATTSQPGTTVTDTTTSPPVDTQPPVTTTEPEPTTIVPPTTITQPPKASVTQTPRATTTSEPPDAPAPPPTTTSAEEEPTVTPPPSTTEEDPYKKLYRAYLLEGYPEDIWPLYGSLAIENCTLDIQFPERNNARDDYWNRFYVRYVTEKDKDEVIEFYKSLLSEPTEQGSFYDAEGIIDGYKVTARFIDGFHDKVNLTVTLPNDPPLTSNPFHEDFPSELFPAFQLHEIWSEYFNVNSNPPSGQVFAALEFKTSATDEEAREFYRELMSEAEGYEETTREEGDGYESLTISGFLHEYDVVITLGLYGNPQLVNIALRQPIE